MSLPSSSRERTFEVALLTDLLQTKDNSLMSFFNLRLIKHQTDLPIPINLNIPISYQYKYIFQQQHL